MPAVTESTLLKSTLGADGVVAQENKKLNNIIGIKFFITPVCQKYSVLESVLNV